MKNRFAFVVSRCSLAHILRQSVIENDVKCFSKNTQMSPQCHIVSHDESLIYQAFGIFCKKNVTFAPIVSGDVGSLHFCA